MIQSAFARACSLFALGLLPLGAVGARADSLDDVLRKGQREWDIAAGYAWDLDIGGNPQRVSFFTVVPRYGYFLNRHTEVLVELPLAYYTEPEDAQSLGLELTLRQHFARCGRFTPFFELGAGGLVENLDLTHLSGEFQFITHAGLGFRYLLNEESSLTFTGRLHHLSNAGRAERNRGVNDMVILIGYTRFLR